MNIGTIKLAGRGANHVVLGQTWLVCDGVLHLVATYPVLFAIIGYTFGGAGVVFAVPNYNLGSSNIPMGAHAAGYAVGGGGGTIAHTHSLAGWVGAAALNHAAVANVGFAVDFTADASNNPGAEWVDFNGVPHPMPQLDPHAAPAATDAADRRTPCLGTGFFIRAL